MSGEFSPSPFGKLTRSGLSGPGVVATGDTPGDARSRLLKLEELLNG